MDALPTMDEIQAMMRAGRYADALGAIHALEDVGSKSPELTYARGICLTSLGRSSEARAAVHQLKEVGSVALAHRLAERLTAENPDRFEGASIEPVDLPPSQAKESRALHYVVGAVGLGFLVLAVLALGPKWGGTTSPTDNGPYDGTTTNTGAVPRESVPAGDAAHGKLSPVESTDITGVWESVDFVRNVDDFVPGRQLWGGDLFLKSLQCRSDGTMSHNCTWKDGTITHTGSGYRAPYFVKTDGTDTYLFYPWISGDVTIRGMKPQYYVLRKTALEPGSTPGRPTSANAARPSSNTGATGNTKTRTGFRAIVPVSEVKPYDDVRWKDMTALDFSQLPGLPATLTFNEDTIWPSALPPGFDPEALIIAGKNPGLDIRGLHRDGVTGKGVSVAIIDQPLFDDHPEFLSKIAAYHDVGCDSNNSMHGPAVASLLVGSSCGTAPDATLYYVAAPSWKMDAEYYAQALEWLIDFNKRLPQAEKIRVVSVSAAPSGPVTPFANGARWDETCAQAEAEGMLVLDCTGHRGIIGPCYYDIQNPDAVERCVAGFPGRPFPPGRDLLLVPNSFRTSAEEYAEGEFGYQYTGRGGLSWSIPYCAGVLALGWQIRPDLPKETMVDLLFRSAYRGQGNARFINPPAFIELVRNS